MKTVILYSLCFCAAFRVFGQTYYEGTIGPLKFGLKIQKEAQAAALYIPEQGLFEYVLKAPVFGNDSLRAELKEFGTVLTGKIAAETFSGQWKQNGFPSPLALKRVEQLSFLKRPQMPVGPFPYQSENVHFANADRSVQFGGTLTFPKGRGKFPAVVLITGSGQQDRDETLFGHKPFWVIADALSREGFAVLRVDDRGIGETTGKSGTSADYAQDVLAAIDFLKARKEINPQKIGLMGHSEGGMIAPMVAVQSKDVAFIVSLAGLGVGGRELLLKQSDDILAKTGTNATYRGHVQSLNAALYDAAIRLPLEDDIKDSLQVAFDRWLKAQPDAVLGQMGFKSEVGKKNVTRQFDQIGSKWYRYFLKYDPQPNLAKIKIPVLALNGSNDVQVSAKENLAGFEKGLTAAGNKNFKTVELPGLNHLFQTCQKCTTAEYGLLEETFSPEALKLIINWLKQQ
ncbi:alpha/beta hydrolase family protein [Runella slithyformis]|uniref:Alpha/beta hydrolase fold protein n=1 Tax=Runella slithyformis (strain ATCC 29530 / DSM 19594 / LMG 11500 / NCIMB 11436 / LSU 4) TaxID=761193 RepID=A0A7U4E603_RUNSL|nr:alpha/beta fold hydrolase [Runella slithyformis]AEI48748.1 alpha/beta hydrolase fold protein [Runella slithyformis DSM 19594]